MKKGGEIGVIYELLKKRIKNKTYSVVEEMQEMLDLYFFKNRITKNQYSELSDMLKEAE